LVIRLATLTTLAATMMAMSRLPARAADPPQAKATSGNKKICITFDELPAAASFADTQRVALNDAILETLREHEVKGAGFVVGSRIEGAYDILGRWLNDGHVLGNLTQNHVDLHQIGIENFIAEIAAGNEALEPMLSGFGQDERYFRFPYLHYGSTVEEKREVRRYLTAKGMLVAHATVVVEDFLYNLSLESAGRHADSAFLAELRNEYLGHVLTEVHRCERLAAEMLKRPCRHILVLRANPLNARFLGDLLDMLEAEGYAFVSLKEALKDELYTAPEAYFGGRGVGYLDMLRQSEADLIPAR
jgi:peptidoglycan/xylan/chitin deacetylase (PgdA/CDA1 family)